MQRRTPINPVMRHLVRRIAQGEGRLLRDVRLRALQESPQAFLSTLHAEARRPATAWEDDADRRACGADQATFVATDEGGCIGLVSAGRSDAHPGVELFSMWVSPPARRLGIGNRLVCAVLDWARACGYDSVGLWVVRDNGPAIRLYERLGFVARNTSNSPASFANKDLIHMAHTLGRGNACWGG
jgi:ribosomal protein S18 acetylase RimI-like enzyme